MPFDYTKYTQRMNPATGQIEPTEYLASPHSDAYANKGFVISFYHMITGKELRFKAFLTALNETYTPDYASEQVFGRTDPIHTFRGTTRDINLAFQIPAASLSEAYENLAKTQTLIQMQYPAYIDVQNALTIAQAPLIRIKVMNIISDARHYNATAASPTELYDSYQTEDNTLYGLLGVITGLTVDHQLSNADVGVFEKAANTVLPKYIDVNINFKPLHEHTNGWQVNEEGGLFEFDEPAFPYGAAEYNNLGAPQETYIPSNPTRAEQEGAEAEVGKAISGPASKDPPYQSPVGEASVGFAGAPQNPTAN